MEGKRLLEERHSEGGELKALSILHHMDSRSMFSLKAEFIQALKGSLQKSRFTVKQRNSRRV